MEISIIGAGHVGSALTQACVRSGHVVRISAKHPQHAQAVAQETGATPAGSNREAAEGADLIIMAVPAKARASVAEEIAETAAGKVVMDVTNVINSDMSGLTAERSGAQDLQDMLPGAHVVKAISHVFAVHQDNPVLGGEPLDGLYAGDDPDAKARVHRLLSDIGFHPIDCGGLSMARVIEDMALLNVALNARHESPRPWQTEWKLLGTLE